MPLRKDFGQEPDRTDKLSAIRYVVITLRGTPFEHREQGYRPLPIWHRTVRLTQVPNRVKGGQKLEDGIALVAFTAHVQCQATVEYVCRWYGLRDLQDVLNLSGHAGVVENLIRIKLAATPWCVLASAGGLLEVKQAI